MERSWRSLAELATVVAGVGFVTALAVAFSLIAVVYDGRVLVDMTLLNERWMEVVLYWLAVPVVLVGGRNWWRREVDDV